MELRNVDSVASELGKIPGFDVRLLHGNTYRDQSIVTVTPTRGAIHPKVVQSWLSMARPMNHKAGIFFIAGDEVGAAYNRAIETILEHPSYKTFKYIMTLEDDNIVPASAILLLLQAIERGGYDAVGGLYHMKGPMAVPMAFGTPGTVDDSGFPDMAPRDLTDAIMAGDVVEVNGIACGCTLWRMDLFREMPGPWFKTFTRFRLDDTVELMTQDLYFCRQAKALGKRFAIDTRVKVGHIDTATGEVF